MLSACLSHYCIVANALYGLNRYDEALKIYEDVVPKISFVMSEDHNFTSIAMVGLARTQFDLNRVDDANQTATRGLLLARRVGNE
jgi:predicted negative regulator of RcsB-dependent stress response